MPDAKTYLQIRKTLFKSKEVTILIFRFGDALLEKETLALPEIVEVLGMRPYPLKSTILEYLQEL